MPDAKIHKMKFGRFSVSFREAPLTLTTLAGLVPSELNAEIKLVDESISKIPFNEHYDLVGISCLTGTAKKAYRIADIFMRKGSGRERSSPNHNSWRFRGRRAEERLR